MREVSNVLLTNTWLVFKILFASLEHGFVESYRIFHYYYHPLVSLQWNRIGKKN